MIIIITQRKTNDRERKREREKRIKLRGTKLSGWERVPMGNVNSNYNRDPTVDIKTYRVKSSVYWSPSFFVVYGFQSNRLEE